MLHYLVETFQTTYYVAYIKKYIKMAYVTKSVKNVIGDKGTTIHSTFN